MDITCPIDGLMKAIIANIVDSSAHAGMEMFNSNCKVMIYSNIVCLN